MYSLSTDIMVRRNATSSVNGSGRTEIKPGQLFQTDPLFVIPLHPGPLHAGILEKLISDHGATGPLVTDAILAALAMEHGALLASTDQDFRRFPELRWLNPLAT